jgi:hypothetical protein
MYRYVYGAYSKNVSLLNPYPANVEHGELLPMLENGRWDLIRRLNG